MILFGIFFAWETRKVRVEGLNDSKQIGICVYNVMIMSALALPMVYILTDSQINIIYSIISAAILICATSTLGFVFVSKVSFFSVCGGLVIAWHYIIV
jgi:gamma-aminobutyric acid type B receptor